VKLRGKLSIVVISSILLGITIMILLVFLFGNVISTGYTYEDLDRIKQEIAQEIAVTNADTHVAVQQIISSYAAQNQGIDFEWMRTNGDLLYASTGRVSSYTLEEMTERFANQPLFSDTIDSPFRVSFGNEPSFLILTLHKNVLRDVLFYAYFSGSSNTIFFLIPPVMLILIPALSAYLFIAAVNRRIRKLNHAIQHTALHHNASSELADRSRDEIGQLTRHFNAMSGKINQQFKQLHDSEERRRQLVSNLSHDLRTPLTSILGYAETLAEGASDSKKTAEWSSVIVQRSRYMMRLLKQLFEVSLRDHEHAAIRETINVSELLRRIVMDYAYVLEERQIIPDIRMPEQDVWLPMDMYAFERTVRNLIDNALKYGGDGNYLGIQLNEDRQTIQLSIADHGKGIVAEEIPNIFEPFYKVEKGRSSDGLGLGLQIVAEFAAAHQGNVQVESEPGVSTVFTIELPK